MIPSLLLQLHVLTFTVNLLLKGLANRLSAGDLDPCVDILIEVKTIQD